MSRRRRVPIGDCKYGPILISNLVPKHYKNLTAITLATGLAASTLNKWKFGRNNPDLASVTALAALVGEDPLALLSDAGNVTASGSANGVHERSPSVDLKRLERLEAVAKAAREYVSARLNFPETEPHARSQLYAAVAMLEDK